MIKICDACRMSVSLPIYSARDSAITQRPTSTAILAIDSEDRFKDYLVARNDIALTADNASPYDFTIRKDQSIMNGFFTRLGVTEVNFPWVIPNINKKTNKMRCRFQVGAAPVVTRTINLASSFMTPSQIASALQTIIRGFSASLAAFTMTYGVSPISIYNTSVVNVFAYDTNAAGVTIAFDPIDYNSTDYPYPPATKQLFDLLGFYGRPPPLTILDPPATGNRMLTTANYGNVTLCQSIRYIDIVCSQLVYNQANKDVASQPIYRDMLCRLYVNDPGSGTSTVLPNSSTYCPPGCAPLTIYRDFAQPKQIQWIPNQPIPGVLRFEVYDDTGAPLTEMIGDYFTGGENWSLTLLITEN